MRQTLTYTPPETALAVSEKCLQRQYYAAGILPAPAPACTIWFAQLGHTMLAQAQGLPG